jgi:hypothetical protein
MVEAERLNERLDALLRLAQGSAGSDFSGLGVIVAQNSASLPIFAIGPPITLNPEDDTATILGAISRQQSAHHDGFHVLNPALKLKAISQYFSPPIVSRLRINRSAPFGGRYLAALFGSMLDGVLATAIATPALGVIIFINGEEVSRRSL